jgi:hypothetical protein
VDNNYLDLGMSKSGFIHTLPSGRLSPVIQLSTLSKYITDKDCNTYWIWINISMWSLSL